MTIMTNINVIINARKQAVCRPLFLKVLAVTIITVTNPSVCAIVTLIQNPDTYPSRKGASITPFNVKSTLTPDTKVHIETPIT